MDNNDAIVVKNLSKRFKINQTNEKSLFNYFTYRISNSKSEELVVLDDVSFSVKKGEMLGIIGFNGSGKTTLLKILAKIYAPDSGSVEIQGKLIPFLEIGTGFNREFSARENIITYGILLGFSKREIESKIDEIAKFGEIEKFLDTKVKNFSAGMNARLAFSTAIQVNPDILLIDEILSVGDIVFQKKSFEAIMEFKKQNKTMIFVSHSIEQMEKICDRIIWLHKGKIFDEGNPSKVISHYKQFAENQK